MTVETSVQTLVCDSRLTTRMAHDPVGLLVEASRLGDVVLIMPTRDEHPPTYLFFHPDAIRDVLVTRHTSFRKGQQLEELQQVLGRGMITTERDEHRDHRRAAQPLFHRNSLSGYVERIENRAANEASSWTDGELVAVERAMSNITLDVVLDYLFGTVGPPQREALRPGLEDADRAFERCGLPFSDFLVERASDPASDADELWRLVGDLVRRGIAAGSRIVELAARVPGSAVESDWLIAECIGLLLAGHVTTASALSWAWLLLARHDESRSRLLADVDTAGAPSSTRRDPERLSVAEAAVAETMRLYPPAWGTHRRALGTVDIAGVEVPRGALVIVSQFVTHRDSRWWPRPDQFDIARWDEDTRTRRPRYAYFPFGGGPRLCIGEPLAWLEAATIIATISRRWVLNLDDGGPLDMASAETTLRPPSGVEMEVCLRR